MQLTDGVVIVRPPTQDDAPQISDAVRASIDTLRAWLPWATPGYSAEHACEWIDEAIAAGRHPFVIFDPEGRLIGSVGLQHADLANRCVQIGWWVGSGHTGHGYATRAARLVVTHAFETLDFHRVEMLVSVQNRPSQRVAERLGARLEATLAERLEVGGEWHDSQLYVLLQPAG